MLLCRDTNTQATLSVFPILPGLTWSCESDDVWSVGLAATTPVPGRCVSCQTLRQTDSNQKRGLVVGWGGCSSTELEWSQNSKCNSLKVLFSLCGIYKVIEHILSLMEYLITLLKAFYPSTCSKMCTGVAYCRYSVVHGCRHIIITSNFLSLSLTIIHIHLV